MNVKEAYAIGFLTRCADEGLSPAQTAARIKKAVAMHKRAGVIGDLVNLVGRPAGAVAGAVGSVAKPLALLGPPAAGAALGYGLSQTQDDHFSVQDAQKDEELAEYYRAIETLGRLKAEPQAA